MTLFDNINNLPSHAGNMNRNYRGVSRLHDDIDRLFGGFFDTPTFAAVRDNIMPSLDVTSDDKSYAMHIELPGVSPEAVEIKVSDNTLIVSGEKKQEVMDKTNTHVQERTYGSFMRSMTLPDDADAENITATAKDGVLTITIQKKAPEESKTRTITVQKA